jgi:hypothetical protein
MQIRVRREVTVRKVSCWPVCITSSAPSLQAIQASLAPVIFSHSGARQEITEYTKRRGGGGCNYIYFILQVQLRFTSYVRKIDFDRVKLAYLTHQYIVLAASVTFTQRWAAILKNVSIKAIQLHIF